jgi:hypothetical protein
MQGDGEAYYLRKGGYRYNVVSLIDISIQAIEGTKEFKKII